MFTFVGYDHDTIVMVFVPACKFLHLSFPKFLLSGERDRVLRELYTSQIYYSCQLYIIVMLYCVCVFQHVSFAYKKHVTGNYNEFT